MLYAIERGCTHPGCDVPPYWCQVHHATKGLGATAGRPTSTSSPWPAGPHNRLVNDGGWSTRKRKDGTTEWIPPPHLDRGQRRTNNFHHPERMLPDDKDDDDKSESGDAAERGYDQPMRGSKILITGPTGQVATPIARALAADNEVWGIARFTNAAAREGLEKAGVRCETVNLAAGDFTGLPSDFDYVLNLAVAKSGDWDKDLGANAESVGLLMAHCRNAKAFLHCSSAAVYDPPDDEPRTERAALGDNHKPCFPPIPSPRSPARSSPGRWRAPWACPPPSPASTSPTATTAGGRTTTWR